jgi:hypothetical protein
LTTLKDNKISPDKIHLVVHTKEQADMYRAGIPKEMYNSIIITNENKGIYGQMNWVFKHFKEGQHILKLDDDISSFKKLQGEKLVKMYNIGDVIDEGFKLCEQKGYKLFGIYPTANAYFMKGQKDYTEDLRFVVGAFMGIINQRDNQIDIAIKIKGDYEYAINSFIKNGGMIRFNRIAFNYDITKNEGERINTMKSDAKILIRKHPTLVKENNRRGDKGEILLSKGGDMTGGKITDRNLIPVDDPDSKEVFNDKIVLTDKVKKLQEKLVNTLENTNIPKIRGPNVGKWAGTKSRGDLLGYNGYTFTLGCGRRRYLKVGEFSTNKKYPELLKLVIEYGNEILPSGFKYSAITINKNLKAKKHIDAGNAGIGCITFLGDYTGGGLYLYNPERKLYETKNKLIAFNGSNIAHMTQPFKGDRYAFIFYNQTECEIPRFTMEGKGLDGGESLFNPVY